MKHLIIATSTLSVMLIQAVPQRDIKSLLAQLPYEYSIERLRSTMDEIPIPTEAATEYSCPTEAATEAPTEAPSESSCPVATEAPTEAPSESSCPVATEAPTESSCPSYEDDEYLGEEIPIPPIPANDTAE